MINLAAILVFLSFGIFIGYYLSRLNNKRKDNAAEQKALPNPAPETEILLEKKLMLEESITIIKKLSETVSSSLNITDLAGEIVKTTCGILNVEICVLFLLDEETDTLDVIASAGIEDAVAKTMHIKKGEEITGVVAMFSEVKIINELEKEPAFYNLKQDSFYKQSLASLPLSFKNKAIGVLNVSNKKSGKPFSATDEQVLKIIALETAIALQNSKLFQEQQKSYLNTIIALANAIDARDPYTYHHSNNVTRYEVAMAKEINLGEKKIENIRYAGLLHDIGKIGIKDSILTKPGKLNDEEYNQIKSHPLKGEEIIKSLPFLKEITKMVRHHHERFDGKGYPDGIKGERIEIGARILAIADSFDAMTTKRVYRDPMTLAQAREELIKNKNTQFDSSLVDYFIQILEKEPAIISENQR